VAVITGITARDVRRILAGCGNAVMAGAAGAKNLSVIDSICRCPDAGIVAVLADVAGLKMRRSFTGGIRAVVAVYAVVRDVRVIEIRRKPADG